MPLSSSFPSQLSVRFVFFHKAFPDPSSPPAAQFSKIPGSFSSRSLHHAAILSSSALCIRFTRPGTLNASRLLQFIRELPERLTAHPCLNRRPSHSSQNETDRNVVPFIQLFCKEKADGGKYRSIFRCGRLPLSAGQFGLGGVKIPADRDCKLTDQRRCPSRYSSGYRYFTRSIGSCILDWPAMKPDISDKDIRKFQSLATGLHPQFIRPSGRSGGNTSARFRRLQPPPAFQPLLCRSHLSSAKSHTLSGLCRAPRFLRLSGAPRDLKEKASQRAASHLPYHIILSRRSKSRPPQNISARRRTGSEPEAEPGMTWQGSDSIPRYRCSGRWTF